MTKNNLVVETSERNKCILEWFPNCGIKIDKSKRKHISRADLVVMEDKMISQVNANHNKQAQAQTSRANNNFIVKQ